MPTWLKLRRQGGHELTIGAYTRTSSARFLHLGSVFLVGLFVLASNFLMVVNSSSFGSDMIQALIIYCK